MLDKVNNDSKGCGRAIAKILAFIAILGTILGLIIGYFIL